MVYLTHYEQTAVYEPAEGGYYVAETYALSCERMSLRQARKRIQDLWDECIQENDSAGYDYWVQKKNRKGHDQSGFNPSFRIQHTSRNIGEDEFYCIDRIQNEHENYYRGYC